MTVVVAFAPDGDEGDEGVAVEGSERFEELPSVDVVLVLGLMPTWESEDPTIGPATADLEDDLRGGAGGGLGGNGGSRVPRDVETCWVEIRVTP